MLKNIPIEIITCPQWGAVKPKHGLELAPRFDHFLFHHTAGHHTEIDTPKTQSRKESIRYARDIQHFHMAPEPRGNDWVDSGHNFLICRNGLILQGRWLTVSAIQAGHMVVSAHCPGHNGQIGIEHEHKGDEQMTEIQRESSARLMAWCALHSGYKKMRPVYPHSKFFPTSCPTNLIKDIPIIKRRAEFLLHRAVS